MTKYHLPASHPLFRQQRLAELKLEMYEDLYMRQQELETALAAKDSGDKTQILKQLSAVTRALGEEEVIEDPLVAQWDKDLEEGRLPDLDRTA